METTAKTQVFNVIILDKSGSMSNITNLAINGVNETIQSIKRNQEKYPEQEHMLTLVAFCGCEVKKIYNQCPITEVAPITSRDYRPCCMTPLYDAIGTTISEVHSSMTENAMASVTIITDGYENASKEFSHRAIKSLIEAYKSEGWLFAYIGAEHDVEAVSFSLSIDNHMNFDKTPESTANMFDQIQFCQERFLNDMAPIMNSDMSADEKRNELRKRSINFFNEN